MLRRSLLALTALAAILPLSAVQAQEPIKIGAILSTTGPASYLGVPGEKTLTMLAEQVNAAGGLLDGRKIELVIYDDGGDAKQAATFATRLIEDDEVDIIIGPNTTGTTMAAVPVIEAGEIVAISLGGGVPIVEPVKKWVFKTPHTDRMACERLLRDMKSRGFTTIGMISGTGGFGASMSKECRTVAQAEGITIAADETYGPKDTDMTAQLTKIKGTAGIQAVLNADFGQGPAVLTRQYRQLGLEFPLYQSHGVASKEFIALAGDAAEGVRLTAAGNVVAEQLADSDPQKPVVMEYKTQYEAKFNEPVSAFGANAYDGFWLAVNAIKAAGTTDKPAVRDALEKISGWMGANGPFTMSPTDHNGLTADSLRVIDIKGGNWVVVN